MCEVSIIIPVYNVEKYVERCLRSALEQDFISSYEILIIDDCGTDNSMSIVESLSASHPQGQLIRIVHHPENRGLGEASNTGITEARGKYVYFLDSDDWISKDCIRLLYEESEKYQNEVTIAGMQRVTDSQTLASHGFTYFHVEKTAALIQMAMEGKNVTETRWNKMYLLSFIRDNNIHCTHRWHEDIFWGYQISCNCRKLSLLPHYTYFYYVNETSITQSKNLNSYKLKVFASIFRDIADYTSNSNSIPCVYDYYLAIIRGVFSHVSRLISTQDDVRFFSNTIGSFMKPVPSLFSLRLWKNRYFYLFFKFQDSFSHCYRIVGWGNRVKRFIQPVNRDRFR